MKKQNKKGEHKHGKYLGITILLRGKSKCGCNRNEMKNNKNPRIQCENNVCRGFILKEYIEERAIEIATYIIENNATVRQTA